MHPRRSSAGIGTTSASSLVGCAGRLALVLMIANKPRVVRKGHPHPVCLQSRAKPASRKTAKTPGRFEAAASGRVGELQVPSMCRSPHEGAPIRLARYACCTPSGHHTVPRLPRPHTGTGLPGGPEH